MKGKDVKIDAAYAVKVSGKVVPVRITGESPYGGWDGQNLATHRSVRIRSAAKLRFALERNPDTGKYQPVVNEEYLRRKAGEIGEHARLLANNSKYYHDQGDIEKADNYAAAARCYACMAARRALRIIGRETEQ